MYVCSVCNCVSQPGAPMLRHAVHRTVPHQHVSGRTRQEIAAEFPVCAECAHFLKEGVPLSVLVKQKGAPIPVARKAQALSAPRGVGKIHTPPARKKDRRCLFCRTGIGTGCSCSGGIL